MSWAISLKSIRNGMYFCVREYFMRPLNPFSTPDMDFVKRQFESTKEDIDEYGKRYAKKTKKAWKKDSIKEVFISTYGNDSDEVYICDKFLCVLENISSWKDDEMWDNCSGDDRLRKIILWDELEEELLSYGTSERTEDFLGISISSWRGDDKVVEELHKQIYETCAKMTEDEFAKFFKKYVFDEDEFLRVNDEWIEGDMGTYWMYLKDDFYVSLSMPIFLEDMGNPYVMSVVDLKANKTLIKKEWDDLAELTRDEVKEKAIKEARDYLSTI